MPRFHRHTLVVDGTTIDIVEAGPSRCQDTVVIVGADDEMTHALLVRLGRFIRVVSIPEQPAAIVEELGLSNIHVVVDLGTNTVDEVVNLLQRTVTID